ncbi:exodeoxyribonuclease V subunit alpha [Thioalkalivibrio sp. HK1]|uniref:exodeoxyribonuclease V subunit alpha n=1 Tax=Thioalkalivibrio sp. HK1 TaxID=1469245 RepID=UPI0004712E83|nr:exodeoxyribonuclease V subunit alpha [Thioalkalivibrio sp. HK1]
MKSSSPTSVELGDIDHRFASLIRQIDQGIDHAIDHAGKSDPDDPVWLAAALASCRNRDGHVCLDIKAEGGSDLILSKRFSQDSQEGDKKITLPTADRWFDALARSRAVMRPDDEAIRPLVLEASGGGLSPDGQAADGQSSDGTDERIVRLYLHRMWEAQRTIVRKIQGLIDGDDGKAPPADPAVEEKIDAVFGAPADSTRKDEDQRKAAQVALRHRLCVITGGPGTGKTTTVANIIALLVEGGLASCERIKLAAPTGKAASRLSASVKERCARLASRIPALADLDSATTLHRLLLHAKSHLPLQVLIIDECSMVDISLMARTLSTLPADARLILLGDADQLSSVQPGSVFADLCPSAATGSALSPCVVRLGHNWRFPSDQGIGRLAGAIIEGRAKDAIACLRDLEGGKGDDAENGDAPDAGDNRIERQAMEDIQAFDRLADECATNHFLPMIRNLSEVGFPHDGEATEAAIESLRKRFEGFRVLCAHRRGAFGSERFNRRVEESLRERGLAPYGETFYLGRPIIVNRNDSHTGLANGDTGIVVHDTRGEKRVWFPDVGGDDKNPRLISPGRLPEHESFFALTIHRSQGSEYDEVAVVLGPADSPLATRQLLYTAVTRARKRVVLHAQEAAIEAAVDSDTVRGSGLPDALLEIGRAPPDPP